MAVAMTSAEGVKRVTNDATGGDATKVTLPSGAIAVMLYSVAAAGKVAHTGTDGAALGSEYATIPATTWTTIPLTNRAAWASAGGAPIIYIAHTDNSGVTEVVPVFA